MYKSITVPLVIVSGTKELSAIKVSVPPESLMNISA